MIQQNLIKEVSLKWQFLGEVLFFIDFILLGHNETWMN